MEIEKPHHLLSDQIQWVIVFYKEPEKHELSKFSNGEIARLLGQLYNRPTLSYQQVKFIYDKCLEKKGVENFWKLVEDEESHL